MCPACISGAALIAGSTISTGGLAALAAKLLRLKNNHKNSNQENGKEK